MIQEDGSYWRGLLNLFKEKFPVRLRSAASKFNMQRRRHKQASLYQQILPLPGFFIKQFEVLGIRWEFPRVQILNIFVSFYCINILALMTFRLGLHLNMVLLPLENIRGQKHIAAVCDSWPFLQCWRKQGRVERFRGADSFISIIHLLCSLGDVVRRSLLNSLLKTVLIRCSTFRR